MSRLSIQIWQNAVTTDSRWSNVKNNRSGAEGFALYTKDKHQFLPIPRQEMSVNTKLKQNSYWSKE